jgi:hypothetical protein
MQNWASLLVVRLLEVFKDNELTGKFRFMTRIRAPCRLRKKRAFRGRLSWRFCLQCFFGGGSVAGDSLIGEYGESSGGQGQEYWLYVVQAA